MLYQLGQILFFIRVFRNGVPSVVWDCFVGFKQIVSESWVAPPWVVLAWAIFCDGKVRHGALLIPGFRRFSPFDFQVQVILTVFIMAAFDMIWSGLMLRIPTAC